jgi:hypothetical protein
MTANATMGIAARPLRVLAPALAAGLLLASLDASATLYRTTLTLTNPNNTDIPATTAVYDWETSAAGPAITSTDLDNLTLTLYDGATAFFTDTIIVTGVVQAIGGAARGFADIVWEFDLTTLIVSDYDNDLFVVQAGATGTTYNFYADIGRAVNDQYVDGVYNSVTSSYEFTQQTEERLAPVAPTALILLAGLPLLRARRRAA